MKIIVIEYNYVTGAKYHLVDVKEYQRIQQHVDKYNQSKNMKNNAIAHRKTYQK